MLISLWIIIYRLTLAKLLQIVYSIEAVFNQSFKLAALKELIAGGQAKAKN